MTFKYFFVTVNVSTDLSYLSGFTFRGSDGKGCVCVKVKKQKLPKIKIESKWDQASIFQVPGSQIQREWLKFLNGCKN